MHLRCTGHVHNPPCLAVCRPRSDMAKQSLASSATASLTDRIKRNINTVQRIGGAENSYRR